MQLNKSGLREYIFRWGARGIKYVRAKNDVTAKLTLIRAIYSEREEKHLNRLTKDEQRAYLLQKYGGSFKLLGENDNPQRSYPDDIAKAAN